MQERTCSSRRASVRRRATAAVSARSAVSSAAAAAHRSLRRDPLRPGPDRGRCWPPIVCRALRCDTSSAERCDAATEHVIGSVEAVNSGVPCGLAWHARAGGTAPAPLSSGCFGAGPHAVQPTRACAPQQPLLRRARLAAGRRPPAAGLARAAAVARASAAAVRRSRRCPFAAASAMRRLGGAAERIRACRGRAGRARRRMADGRGGARGGRARRAWPRG